jgi:hypothetical protein
MVSFSCANDGFRVAKNVLPPSGLAVVLRMVYPPALTKPPLVLVVPPLAEIVFWFVAPPDIVAVSGLVAPLTAALPAFAAPLDFGDETLDPGGA